MGHIYIYIYICMSISCTYTCTHCTNVGSCSSISRVGSGQEGGARLGRRFDSSGALSVICMSCVLGFGVLGCFKYKLGLTCCRVSDYGV